ncbi:hypothetical protein LTR85_009651 [Meristemomyces frigidus]|nr:hypothetical protein LTR85_009651 [Meristemomyces frigidus]
MAPSLDSLPAELVEAIAQDITDYADQHQSLFSLRSTCRAMEAGTRRSFAKRYFSSRTVDMVSDSLEELVAISKVRDLAASFTDLRFASEDDGIARLPSVAEAASGDGSGTRFNAFSITAGPLLTLALSGLPNVKDFHFVERRPFHRAAEGYDPYNITSTFATALGAMHACGTQPREIQMYADSSLTVNTGILEEFAAFCFTRLCSCLEVLQLVVLDIGHEQPFDDQEPLGIRLGTQFALTVPHLTSLRELHLDFSGSWYSKSILHHIASCQPLPPLSFLNLLSCAVEPHDLFGLLQACRLTLKVLYCLQLSLLGDSRAWLLKIFCLIGAEMTLQRLKLDQVSVEEGMLEFPNLYSALFWNDEEEEDYIWVERVYGVNFSGAEEVTRGVGQMPESMVIVAR